MYDTSLGHVGEQTKIKIFQVLVAYHCIKVQYLIKCI